ncbi:MAG: PocR ligand-binding domain-containing protein [Rhodocyclaceae bacterium]|nr:PocR ligand-binding domain-containing protein [Rhodocyclaceae bacterium]
MNRIAKFVVDHALLVWAILLLTTLAAAYLVSEAVRDRLEHERLSSLKLDAERRGIELMSQTLNGNQMGAIGLLGLIDENAKQEALNARVPNTRGAAMLMENIARVHDADGAYIVGQDGVIKSSWGVGRPLTGVDVKFRPYFQMAFKGKENVYAAIGTTTGRRNLYYATPMYAGNTTDTPVIGAVVMRTGVVRLDKLVAGAGGIALLLSPQGIVFSASDEEWIGRAAGHLTPERIKEIRRLKQFGTMFDTKDPQLLPFAVEPGISDLNGVRRAAVQARVHWNDPYGDWTLVVIEDLSHTVPAAARLRFGLSAGMLILLLGWMVMHLLRGHHRQVLTSEQLATYSRAQQASAERKSRLAAAALLMQQAKSPTELIRIYLNEAHRVLGAWQGVVYVVDDGSAGTLHLAGQYACADAPPAALAVGEGLLGQCAVERRLQLIETGLDGFAIIRSGLGETRPAALMLAPILLNDVLLGVVELALLAVPGAAEREQFEEMTGFLAMNLEILGRSAHTEERLTTTVAAERAIAEQLAFQQALVDTIPYPLFYKDADTRFLGVNRAYEETFAVKRETLIGKRVLDLEYLPEADRLAYQAEDEATIASAGMVRRDTRIPFADGKLHDTLYYVSGFRRQDGAPGGLVGTFIDFSAVKDAERELERLADAERFNRLAHGRELRILELKQEVNDLAQAAGRPLPYVTTIVETIGDHDLAPHPDYRTDLTHDGRPLQLADLVDLGELQKLFAAFCESVGIAAAIIDLDAKVLASSRWQRACTDFHRVNPESCARCIESDTELALKLQDGQDYTMYTCKNGMTDCASPIIVEGQHLANVFIGQFHLGPPDLEFFRRQARQFDYPEADYLKAVSEAPVVDERRLPIILGFLSGFARMISSASLARRRADAAQQRLQEQAELLRKERLAAMSLAEDNAQARHALAHEMEQQQ